MKRSTEFAILMGSTVKWLVFGSLVGAVVGTSTALFLVILDGMMKVITPLPYSIGLLPLGLTLSWWLTTTVAPEAQGHGTDRVIQAIHRKEGVIDARVIPTKLLATLITIAGGGSAGNIGPCAQIGSGLCSRLAVLCSLDDLDRKRLVICGLSAGFASVLGTPVAGAVFAAEALFIGRLYYGVLLPSLTAGLVGSFVASAWGLAPFHIPLQEIPSWNLSLFLTIGLAGIVFGIGGLLFIEMLNQGKSLAKRIQPYGPAVGLVGGFTLIGVATLFSQDFLGLGWQTVTQTLEGKSVPWYAFLLKSLTTSLTLNFGGSGGIILPIGMVGASLGSVFAEWVHVDRATFAALGFVSLLAGTTNTPITASILAIELFGPELLPFAAITSTISFLLTGHRSAIPTQLVHEAKSPTITLDTMEEIEHVLTSSTPRYSSLLQRAKQAWKSKNIAQK